MKNLKWKVKSSAITKITITKVREIILRNKAMAHLLQRRQKKTHERRLIQLVTRQSLVRLRWQSMANESMKQGLKS